MTQEYSTWRTADMCLVAMSLVATCQDATGLLAFGVVSAIATLVSPVPPSPRPVLDGRPQVMTVYMLSIYATPTSSKPVGARSDPP